MVSNFEYSSDYQVMVVKIIARVFVVTNTFGPIIMLIGKSFKQTEERKYRFEKKTRIS